MGAPDPAAHQTPLFRDVIPGTLACYYYDRPTAREAILYINLRYPICIAERLADEDIAVVSRLCAIPSPDQRTSKNRVLETVPLMPSGEHAR